VGRRHVLISVNTRTDEFLMIFDAAKECTDEVIKRAYGETWGRLERMSPEEIQAMTRSLLGPIQK
jgi:hypothetical protein